jgi:hypothetical protein
MTFDLLERTEKREKRKENREKRTENRGLENSHYSLLSNLYSLPSKIKTLIPKGTSVSPRCHPDSCIRHLRLAISGSQALSEYGLAAILLSR